MLSHSSPEWQAVKLTPSLHFAMYRYPLDKVRSIYCITQLVSPTIVIYPVDNTIQTFSNCSLKFKVDCSNSTFCLCCLITWFNVICLFCYKG